MKSLCAKCGHPKSMHKLRYEQTIRRREVSRDPIPYCEYEDDDIGICRCDGMFLRGNNLIDRQILCHWLDSIKCLQIRLSDIIWLKEL